MNDWFKQAFSKDYVKIYAHRNTEEAVASIHFILTHITLPKDALCLDLCCGFGRHLAQLNKNKINTFGLDLSKDLLDYASTAPQVKGRIIQGDMRRLPFRTKFDFVFSFFSSFGYFSQDEENLQVLHQINKILNRKGGFIIDYLNVCDVRRNLEEEDIRQFPEFSLRQRRWINEDYNFVEKEVTIEDDKGSRTTLERIKLYGLDDFVEFCTLAGLTITSVFGSYEGVPYTNTSERLIILGEKSEG